MNVAAFLFSLGLAFIVWALVRAGAIIAPTTKDPTVRQRTGSAANETSGAYPGVSALKWARARYSFAQDGGAIGNVNLMGGLYIPTGAVVLGGFVDVVTPPTSGGAGTFALQVEGAGDLVAAAAVSGAPWSTAGRKNIIPAWTGLTSVKTTAPRDIVGVIAAAALTAGVVDVYLAYIETV